MMTTNKLIKILSGVATLGIATAMATPAQALITGSLAWSDGTSDFFSQVNPGAGDTFSVTFSPDKISLVNSAHGLFTPPFTPAPSPYTQTLAPAVGNFQYLSGNGTSGKYKLTNDLVFAFSNGATVTWKTDTIFDYGFNPNQSVVQFQLSNAPDGLPIVTGIQPYDVVLPTDTLQFSDGFLPTAGSYNGSVDVAKNVPEPGTILGLLAVGGLGLVSSFKKQK